MSYAALASSNNNRVDVALDGGDGGRGGGGRRSANRNGITTRSTNGTGDGNPNAVNAGAGAAGVGYAEMRRVPLIPRQDQVFQAHYFVPVHVHPDFVVLRAWG